MFSNFRLKLISEIFKKIDINRQIKWIFTSICRKWDKFVGICGLGYWG